LSCREAEVVALRQQLKDSEEKWLEQLMQARQTALDESMQRSTHQQSALEREAEHVTRLQQQLDMLSSSLAVKEAELEAAHRQLGSALDTTHKMEATHAQVCNMEHGVQSADACSCGTASLAGSNWQLLAWRGVACVVFGWHEIVTAVMIVMLLCRLFQQRTR
jgi:DNA repair exonuclease SbcCD ATPase subunit